jgi:transcriptional regulator with XRE-family HTH domain
MHSSLEKSWAVALRLQVSYDLGMARASRQRPLNRFGQRVRQLRRAKGLSLRDLAPEVGVGFTYLSKVENGRLDFGDYPSEALIHRLAEALGADEDELLLLAEKVPEKIRRRVVERPEVFRKFATLDDTTLDGLLVQLGETPAPGRRTKLKSR